MFTRNMSNASYYNKTHWTTKNSNKQRKTNQQIVENHLNQDISSYMVEDASDIFLHGEELS